MFCHGLGKNSTYFFVNVTKIIFTRCQIFHLKCTKFKIQCSLRLPRLIWEKEKEMRKGGGREEGREMGNGYREGGEGVRGRGGFAP